MRLYRDWNPECVLKLHLEESGLLGRVRFFPYVMFTVRGTADQTRWAAGRYDEELGIYVKYPLEKESAERYAWIRSSQDWERLAADTPAAFHAEGGPPRKRKLSRYGKRLRRLKRIATLGIVRS
jgi:hypothetical protein